MCKETTTNSHLLPKTRNTGGKIQFRVFVLAHSSITEQNEEFERSFPCHANGRHPHSITRTAHPNTHQLSLDHHLMYYTPLIIPNAQNLEQLYLCNCHFSGDELTSLLHVLQHLTKLQLLILRDSTIENLHQVAIAISNSKSLKRV